MTRWLPLLVLPLFVACAGSAGDKKDSSDAPDLGSESAADSATHPATLVPLSNGFVATASLAAGSQWAGFSFSGHAGDSISIYAQALKTVDTIAYLYKVSTTTGRPYGRALASNDDTDDASWTSQATDSSIVGFKLPETRRYAILVTSYKQRDTGFAHVWWQVEAPTHTGTLPFVGSGSATPVDYKDLSAQALPINPDVIATAQSAHTNNFYVTPVRIKAPPADLAATLADPTRLATFAYDVLYNSNAIYNGNNPHLTATATPIAASLSSATSTMAAAVGRTWGVQQKQLDDADAAVLASIFADGAFATTRVNVYKLHWDNSDDTNAEGILVVDAASGEARALTFVVPP